MITSKRQLIDELTSPLHRIMWIYDAEEPKRRSLENNICAFHIGNGYFLSVAHNLRLQAGYFKSIDEALFQKELLYKLDGSQKLFFDQHFFTDEYTRKMYLNHADGPAMQGIINILKQKRFDTRWVTLAKKKICNPHVIINFKENTFFQQPELASFFKPHQVIYEQEVKKFTYMVPVELVEAFYSADIALYRIIDTAPEIIGAIPSIDIDTEFYEDNPANIFCLQSSPASSAGRLLNEAKIEGIMEHFGIFHDEIEGNYNLEGLRYLLKGYFRFGSSGAPYLLYDYVRNCYAANAIQSEASPIQLSIKNEKEGNFQYVNAIASPLYLIKDRLRELGIIK